MDILTILTTPVHEHEISFHFFVSSISFIGVLEFSKCRFFNVLEKINFRYFILFEAIVNRTVFLISPSI